MPLPQLIVVLLALILLSQLFLLLRRTKSDTAALEKLIIGLEKAQQHAERAIKDELGQSRQESSLNSRSLREEIGGSLQSTSDSLVKTLAELTRLQGEKMDAMRAENAQKLEQIRHTVDEQLQGTLERRLGESFKQVSERLEQVHRGLGEMQVLTSGVGDLKRVLTNVKTRGTWGEMQLATLLEQHLSTEQYARNVETNPGSNCRVEFAIRMPGQRSDNSPVWLPIDAKFPVEDYERLIEASERADVEAVEACARAIEACIKACARDIRDKYVSPPNTVDFALLYLPTEGLYSEVLRRPGLVGHLQTEFRVHVVGPMTLWAVLTSLQVGFRSLAIEQRSSEVWQLLGAVKNEFGKFGGVLDKLKQKLEQASTQIDSASRRSRVIERKLRDVGQLSAAETPLLVSADESMDVEEPGATLL